MIKPKLLKSACFNDIHWGRRNSSEAHNTDCLNYVKWFIEEVKKSGADHIIFMGDWFETRSSINIHTLHYAWEAVTLLSELGLPIFMIIGNHDCYYKNSRTVHSLIQYKEFPTVRIIDAAPTVIDEIGDGVLMVPYLFHAEYETLKDYLKLNLKSWFGHFEFQGFVITGQNHKMLVGPSPADYAGPNIFSGHFHKRQKMGNIQYTGNTFPMDYSDAGDVSRGMMVYDHTNNTYEFIDWEQCPKYQRVMLSDLIDNGPEGKLWRGARVRCYVDREINYEESISLKEVMLEEYALREFVLEELVNLNDVARDTEVDLTDTEELEDVDHLVVRLLSQLQTDTIKPQILVDIYNSLEVHNS